MALSSVWGNVPHIDDIDSNMDNTSGKISKEKLTEQKIMKNNVLVTAKIRKLMLRIELWNIYEKIFLSDDQNIKNKNRAAAELLDFALDGQISAQKRIATIFSSDGTIENWETVISKLKYFEDESDTIPLVSTEDTNIPVTEQIVQVRTSDDQVIKEVMLDFATDTYQMACEIQMEYRLPADEIEYMQGMLQHEMMGLARQGMTKQREKLKSIQKKTAIIEHLVMLNENVSMKFHKTSKMYDTSSTHLKASAAPTTPTPSFQTSTRTPVSSKNRTLVHFNKLIIDERRKLDQVEQEMVKLFKKMGKMSASDYYKTKSGIPIFTNGKEIPVDKKANNKSSINSGGNNSAPSPSAKAGGRRASVSLRSVMMQPLQVSTISLEEGDEDDEDGDTFGGSMGSGGGSLRGGLFSPMKSPGPGLGSNTSVVEDDEEEEMNTFGLSDHEIEKKMLFRKSEKDRTLLIAENKRLRDIINSVDMHLPDVMTSAKQLRGSSGNENLDPAAVSNLDDGDLRGLINELNAWDIERDELDGQIDNLNDKKDALKRKIQKQKEKKMKKIADKELMKISMLATMSAMSVSSR